MAMSTGAKVAIGAGVVVGGAAFIYGLYRLYQYAKNATMAAGGVTGAAAGAAAAQPVRPPGAGDAAPRRTRPPGGAGGAAPTDNRVQSVKPGVSSGASSDSAAGGAKLIPFAPQQGSSSSSAFGDFFGSGRK